MVLSNIHTGVKAEACSMLRCKMCLGLQNATALEFLASKASTFLAHLASPFADCHLGMTIVVKSNRGEEPSTACCAYRNDSICWLEETKGHVTPELDVRWGCVDVSKLQCERHALPLFHSDGWQKVASATSFLKAVDGVLHESRTGQRLPYACMLSLNLPIRKSCLTSVLVFAFESALHFIDGCTEMCLAKFLPTLTT